MNETDKEKLMELTDEDIRLAIETLRNPQNKYSGSLFCAYCEKCQFVHFGGNATPKDCFPNLRELFNPHA